VLWRERVMLNWTATSPRRNRANFPRVESNGASRQARGRSGTGVHRAKRSQFAPAGCTNKPNRQGDIPWFHHSSIPIPSLPYKQSQFPGRVRGQTPCGVTTNLGSSAPNEANFPVWTAKASAVRPAGLPWDQACETKPIPRTTNAKRLVERGLGQPTRSLACAKKSQFPSRGKEKTPPGAAALRNATLRSRIRKEANQEIGVPGPAAGQVKTVAA
jgi:hypothetical protein